MKFKNRFFLIAVAVIGGSLLVSCTANRELIVTNKVDESKKEEQKSTTNEVYNKKLKELSSSKDNLNIETDLYGTKEIPIREEIESYVRTLQEGDRYVIKCEDSTLEERAVVTAASGHVPGRVETVDELSEKLKESHMDFYIPAYIPRGFELDKIDIGYYTPYNEANVSAKPIKVEKIESQEEIIVEVYRMEEDYKKNIASIYLEYNDGDRTIHYSFSLSTSSGYNKEPYTQFVKEEFDTTYLEKDGLKIYQKIIPRGYYSGLDLEEGEASTDYFQSVIMAIKIEPNREEIQQEELIKIANSIYKVN